MHPHASSLLPLLPLFPAVGAVLNGLFGKRIQDAFGKQAVHGIAILAPALSCVLAWFLFVQLLGYPAEERALSWVGWNWMNVGLADASFSFWVDPLTATMLLIITTIGTLIHIYSIGYMAEEPAYWRFFCYLNLFVTMMLILVLGDNFLVMFVGWEGVGLASYLLIGFYYKDLANAAAGMKAFIVNRFGDACFVIGLFLLFWGMQGSWTAPASGESASFWSSLKPEFVRADGAAAAEAAVGASPALQSISTPQEKPASLVFHNVREIFENEARRERIVEMEVFGLPLLFLVCVLFFLGATAKSAQIPFYVWLPDAMAGPTPVSALIHAATMVTAGVYMIARLNFIYVLSPGASTVVAVIGATTALFAASMGLFQYDIKKVLAYSTISQLGFMFIGVGVGAYWAGIFHLLTHACFKACLFLGSGSVILGCHHEQDMRRMGGLKKYMPSTARTYLFACIAIAGFPIAAGFCSKDEILWKAFGSAAVLPGANYLIWTFGILAATLTAFYMGRSYFMTFTGEYRGNEVPLVDLYPKDTERAKALFIPEPVRGPSKELLEALAAHGHGHDAHEHHEHEHGHDHHHGGGTPEESPLSITSVLWILGIASLVIGAIVGFPPVISHLWHGGPPLLEHWLEPVMEPSQAVIKAYQAARPDLITGYGAEVTLAVLSVAVASLGWAGAWFFYSGSGVAVRDRLIASADPRVRQVHRIIYNKYFVDELYYAVFIRGGLRFWNFLGKVDKYGIDGLVNAAGFIGRVFGYIQGAIDKYLVDGAVNGVAALIQAGGRKLRTLQTGQIRSYMLGAFGGALAVFVVLITFAGCLD